MHAPRIGVRIARDFGDIRLFPFRVGQNIAAVDPLIPVQEPLVAAEEFQRLGIGIGEVLFRDRQPFVARHIEHAAEQLDAARTVDGRAELQRVHADGQIGKIDELRKRNALVGRRVGQRIDAGPAALEMHGFFVRVGLLVVV